jgi:hemerythrin
MSTGVETVDTQHQKLIGAINSLIESMSAGMAREQLQPLLDWLADYTKKHFAHEEGCMNLHRCPAAAANRAAHAAFIGMLGELQERINTTGVTTSLVLQLKTQLSEWLRNHILRIDTQLRTCVNKKVA